MKWQVTRWGGGHWFCFKRTGKM